MASWLVESAKVASQATASTASGTLNLTGGTFNCYVDILDGGGTVLVEKLKPFFFAPESRLYYGVGPMLGKAFTVGKDLQK